MNLYRVRVVQPKRPGARKFDVSVYIVMAESAAEAERIVRVDEHQEGYLAAKVDLMEGVKSIRWFGVKSDSAVEEV